jgi:hypothetical protein
MAHNVGLRASFGDMYEWIGTHEDAVEVNSTKSYETNEESSNCILAAVTLCIYGETFR